MNPQAMRTSLTHATRLAIVALLAAGAACAQNLEPTSAITSNTIIELDGSGDTLWMVTAKGLNYALATDSALSWSGYSAAQAQWLVSSDAWPTLAYDHGTALVALPQSNPLNPNILWSLDLHATDPAPQRFSFPWNIQNGKITFNDKDTAISFIVEDIAFGDAAWWAAGIDAGLIKIPVAAGAIDMNNTSLSIPGQAGMVLMKDFSGASLARLPDSSTKVIDVHTVSDSSGNSKVLVTSYKRIWIFNPAESTWDTLSTTISDPSVSFANYFQLFVKPGASPGELYAIMAVDIGKDSLTDRTYFYDSASAQWKPFINSSISSLTFTADSVVYAAVRGERLQGFKERGENQVVIESRQFNNRLTSAGASANLEIYDVHFAPHPDDTDGNLWIATNEGLFFSLQEQQDGAAGTPFQRNFREKKIKSGLSETYFLPTVLTAIRTEGIFAYNLSSNADVTISVYDWNMDHVKTIIRDAPRLAAKNKKGGRSTETHDTWNSTNELGELVAPGIYYYKISASNGERDFGKIVVAR
ncbi:MAG: hypothetical protein GF398_14050 [Chitinivibrionales bacterium]|nr:hypothetical protein [Chitinivibrionales bacterium]